MALDDKNKSLLSAKGEEILRSRQQRISTKSPQETDIFRKMVQEMKELDSITAEVDKGIFDRFDQIRTLHVRIQDMKKAAEGLRQQRTTLANKSFENELKKFSSASSINQDFNEVRRSPETYGPSMEMARNVGTIDLSRQARAARADLDQNRKELSQMRADSPEERRAFLAKSGQADASLANAGLLQAALDTQKKFGLDIASQHRMAGRSASAAEQDLEDRRIKADVRSGAFGNKAQVDEQLAAAAKKVVEAFEKLDTAVRTSSDEATELAKEFDGVNKEYQTLQKISNEMSRGGGNTGSNISKFLGVGGSLMQGAGELYRYAGVTSENAQMQNRIGLANLTNQRFDDLESTSRGDYSAWRRVTGNQFAAQVARGRLMGGREEIAQGLVAGGLAARTAGGVVGDTLDTVGRIGTGAAQGGMMGAGAGPWGAGIGAVLGGVGSFLGGAGNIVNNNMATGMAAAQSSIDLSKSNSSIQEFRNAADQQRQLTDVINRVGDSGGQKTVDYLQGLTYSTRGSGGNRGNLFGGLTNTDTVQSLATQGGLKLQDIARLTGMGVGALGKEFGGAGDLMSAGQLSRSGYFQSADQFIQARGQMAGAGGGAKDLEEIMKNAVANGMDSSKNIMQMVEATSAIANTSAGAGVNTFSGVAEGVGKSIDTLRGFGVSENMATRAAQNAAQAVEGFSDTRGADIPNVTQFAKLRRGFGGVSTPQLMALQNLSPSEIRQMQGLQQKGDTAGLQNLSAQLGIGDIQGITSEGSLDKLMGIRRETDVMRMTGGPFMMNADQQRKIQEKAASGQPLTMEERSIVNRGARLMQGRGVSGDAEFGYMSAGGASKGGLSMAPGGAVGATESMIGAAGAFDSSQFSQTMEKLGHDIEGFASSFAKVSATMPQEYMNAAQKSAESLSIPINQFGTSVANLTTSINQLVSKIKEITGESVNIGPAPTNFRSMQNMLNGNVDPNLQVK